MSIIFGKCYSVSKREQMLIIKRMFLLAVGPMSSLYHLALGLTVVFSAFKGLKGQTCPTDWIILNGKCFLYPDTEMGTFSEAKAFCEAEGGRLFEAKTSTAAGSIATEFSLDNFWIGIQDLSSEGYFVFDSSGNQIKDSDWSTGQPDNVGGVEDCVSADADGEWYDDLCNIRKKFVCEDLNDTVPDWSPCMAGWDLINGKCYVFSKFFRLIEKIQ